MQYQYPSRRENFRDERETEKEREREREILFVTVFAKIQKSTYNFHFVCCIFLPLIIIEPYFIFIFSITQTVEMKSTHKNFMSRNGEPRT